MAGLQNLGRRFAGQDPEYLGLFREPALWTAGLGALGVLDAVNSDSAGNELGLNALMTLLPMIGATGGAAALALRSPRVGKYVDDRLAPRLGGRRLQGKKKAEEADQSIELQERVQRMLSPWLTNDEIRSAVTADTRDRLQRVMGYGAMAGVGLGALGVLGNEYNASGAV
jgi:hypothetical protein